MPAIEPNNLPGDHFIAIRHTENENGVDWEVVYVDADGKPLLEVGWLRLDTKSDPWMVDQADAVHGRGPLLYTVAMEFATINSSGLRPHYRNVSAEAYPVWRYYFHKRQDVTHTPLDPTQPFEHDEATRPELRFLYRKDATTIDELNRLKKLWRPAPPPQSAPPNDDASGSP